MSEECGCSKTVKPKDYLMVEATASEASTCEPTVGGASTQNCPNQDPTYDYILSSFLVPIAESYTTIEVCNPNIYSVGEWLQFVVQGVTLKIVSKTGNFLTLANQCDDGSEVEENPDPGLAIPQNSVFIVVGQPPCIPIEDQKQKILDALATAEEICVPDLIESTETAEIQPIGRVNLDAGDIGFGKCLQRIFGIVFKSGTPFLTAVIDVLEANIMQTQRLVIHSTTGEVRPAPNYGDYLGVDAGKQYALSVKKGAETPVGPCYFPCFYYNLLEERGGDVVSAWPNLISGAYTKDYSMDLAALNAFKKNQDHFYVMCRVTFGYVFGGGAYAVAKLLLNGLEVSRLVTYNDDDDHAPINIVSVPIKVMNSDKKITLSVTGPSSNAKIYYKFEIDGIYV